VVVTGSSFEVKLLVRVTLLRTLATVRRITFPGRSGGLRHRSLRCVLWSLAVAVPLTAAQPAQPRPELVLQSGHAHGLKTLAVSPDGRLIASADGGDGTVKLWEILTGLQVRTLYAASAVRSLAFSADSRLLASGNADDTIRTWEVASGRELQRFYVPREGVGALFFGAKGRYLVSLPEMGPGAGRDREPDPALEHCSPVAAKPGFCESHDISVWDLQRGRFLYAAIPPVRLQC
jgi:WD40 repeat protein